MSTNMVAVSITPIGELSDIRTIDAIIAIRSIAGSSLLEAKRTVESMLPEGIGIAPYGIADLEMDNAGMISVLSDLRDKLAAAGVLLRLGNMPMGEFLTARVLGTIKHPER